LAGNAPIRIVLADERAGTRHALQALLTTYEEIEVVAEGTDGARTLALAERHHPDVVLLGYRMPLMNGAEAARAIKNRWPDMKVVMLTMNPDVEEEARSARVDAFLLKGCALHDLVAALIHAAAPAAAAPAARRGSFGASPDGRAPMLGSNHGNTR
jgi:DNA-binding NarL/FixJ family response regulator